MTPLRFTRRALLSAMLAAGVCLPAGKAAAQQTFVAGTVYDRNSNPAVSVWVFLEQGEQRWQFLTGGDGSYFLGYVQPGNYRITVKSFDVEIFSAEITLPMNERFDIRLN
jgi:hypothetical protein